MRMTPIVKIGKNIKNIKNTEKTKKIKTIAFAACAAFLILTGAQTGLCADGPRIDLSVAAPALPVLSGVTQEIEISVTAPDLSTDAAADVLLSAESGWGMLLIGGVPVSSGVVKCTPGIPERVLYRWAGAVPTASPVIERIRAQSSSLDASGEAEFQVGVDLRITDISLPDAVTAGKFNHIGIHMRDEFNPDMDIAALLGRIGVKPEVSLALIADSGASTTRPILSGMDPVARKFFEGEEGSFTDTSYPGRELAPGSLTRDPDDLVVWRSAGGMPTGFTPPAAGRYHIEATLKSNAGGLPIKRWESPPFEAVAGKPDEPGASGMSALISSTLEIISGVDWSLSARAGDEIKLLLERGDEHAAEESLGVYLNAAFSASPVRLFGKYVNALSATDRRIDDLVLFLRTLVGGYGNYGVLLVTKSGVASWSATAADKTPLRPAPDGSVYENGLFIAIPFEAGGAGASASKSFTLRIAGSGLGDTSLWKIIPLGVNAKKYPQGRWTKEILVNTQELTPPPQNVKFN